jgi:aspartyl/asparaginyl beta-hydroxylase (cupin superfamily)
MVAPLPAVERLLDSAARARQSGAAVEELRLLDLAVAQFPDSPHVRNARGMRALADRNLEVAIASFAEAARLDPNEPALRINLASAYRAQGDVEGERKSLQDAIDLDQLQFMPQLRMAELLQRQGLISQAARHWSAVIQLAMGMAEKPALVADAMARGHAFLAEHNTAFEAALIKELGRELPQEDATRRFRACVDAMLGRRRIYQNQCAGIFYPFLPADEYFDRSLFPWFESLERRAPVIRREALALLDGQGANAIRPYVRQEPGTPQNKWSALDNSPEWSACFLWEFGTKNEAVCDLCPETVAALTEVPQNNVPGKAPTAFFSILRPGGHIPAHTGVTNTRAIIHLPLVVPAGCRFRVGGETRAWREGEAFGFDDTIEHEAWNDSDQIRIVLIFDVWNPHLRTDEQAYLTQLFSVADRGLISA